MVGKQHSTAMHNINCSIMHFNAEDEEEWEKEDEVEKGQEEEKDDMGEEGYEG